MELTSEQIKQLHSLGINVLPQHHLVDQKTPSLPLTPSSKSNSTLPLLCISGLTLISFGSLLLLKSNDQTIVPSPSKPISQASTTAPLPTPTSSSIQQYLLISQQFFAQALQSQTSTTPNNTQIITYLNQSLLSATEAIKQYPQDYRGYQQRGLIYQSLLDSQPQLLDNALADLTIASKLNQSSAEITHNLALLFAKKGDASSTVNYLQQTVNLEPTKAQNFYDLARLQQQIGLIPQAIDTYNRLLPLITDLTQKSSVAAEKTALENLLSQNPSLPAKASAAESPTPTIPLIAPDAPTLQASFESPLVIAAPATDKTVTLDQQSTSNSLSGDMVLPSGQKSIVLHNTHISTISKIYLTTTKGGKNLVLQVLSKTDGQATIGLDSPTFEDISLKWWIID